MIARWRPAAVGRGCSLLLAASLWTLTIPAAVADHDPWRSFLEDAGRHRPTVSYPHARCFERAALAHDLPLSLIVAVARGESAFHPVARSSADAYGVMQIQWPGTARHLGIYSLRRLLSPCVNIEAGARYLAELMTRYEGDLTRALAAYNMGPSRVARAPAAVPATGRRYADYIHGQLLSLVASPLPSPAGEGSPSTVAYPREHLLITFANARRAEAFAGSLRRRHPALELRVRTTADRDHAVMLRIASAADHALARAALVDTGFPPP